MNSIKFQAISEAAARDLDGNVVAAFDLADEDGCYPAALIAWQGRAHPTRHGTHMAVVPPDRAVYFVDGAYDFAESLDAVSDAFHRWLRKNPIN
jgi:hypothetical protein